MSLCIRFMLGGKMWRDYNELLPRWPRDQLTDDNSWTYRERGSFISEIARCRGSTAVPFLWRETAYQVVESS